MSDHDLKSDDWLPLLTGTLLLFAVMSTFFFGDTWFERLVSRGWRSTEGTVLGTHVTHKRTRRSRNAVADVAVQYEVDGRIFTCNRLAFGADHYTTTAEAERAVEDLTRGDRVRVWYSGTDPGRSILRRELVGNAHDWLGVLPGSLFGLGGLLAVRTTPLSRSYQIAGISVRLGMTLLLGGLVWALADDASNAGGAPGVWASMLLLIFAFVLMSAAAVSLMIMLHRYVTARGSSR